MFPLVYLSRTINLATYKLLNHFALAMKVCGLDIPDDEGLSNVELIDYIKKLNVKNFRGVFMRDKLPRKPLYVESGIVNLNTSKESGSHWVLYSKRGKTRIYFDSFGQPTPIEIQRYLKTDCELKHNKLVIQRNTDIIQNLNTHTLSALISPALIGVNFFEWR